MSGSDIEKEIPALNLFMMCEHPNSGAFRELPDGFHFRHCNPDALDMWKALLVESPEYLGIVTEYFDRVYAHRASQFYQACLFACDKEDTPVGTCFVWKAYGAINTLHWFKVLPRYEGIGIGRALLSAALSDLAADDYPVYIHTHPTSFRAIKLYSDFGFSLLSGETVGYRTNDLIKSLPYLEAHMPKEHYAKLRISKAPESLLAAALSSPLEEF